MTDFQLEVNVLRDCCAGLRRLTPADRARSVRWLAGWAETGFDAEEQLDAMATIAAMLDGQPANIQRRVILALAEEHLRQ